MCGILWAIYKDDVDSKIVDNFHENLKKISSRGPDYTWFYQDKNLLFWHTRLSIVDTSSAAHQPFERGDYNVIFNGEIYNFHELKNILQEKWYNFTTTSDTEVLVYAYQERGEKCVEKFDGMRAFAIYDKVHQKVFLSRDRIWEKPLVYYHDKERFVFWSEINPIIWLLDKKDINIYDNALSNFDIYNFRHIPSPYTAFQNIFKLEPGYAMSFDIKTFHVKKYKYLNIQTITIQKDPIKQCDELLSQAVQQTCFADVPVGIFLSGWVDSSLIASMMRHRDIMTYSLGYDKDDEELIRAKKIAAHLWLKNKQIHFGEYFKKVDFLDTLKKVIKHYWEPINLMQIIYADIILKEMKKDGIVVAVWWNWADEMFYGYDGMNTLALISKIKECLNPIWWNVLFPNNKIKKYLYMKNLSQKTYIKPKYKQFLYKDILTEIAKEIPSTKLVDIFSWLGLRIENEHSITIVNDISGSMNSMELRTPFLNKIIIDFACSLPIKYKVRSYRNKKENKYILKKVLEKYLPHDLVYTRKMGFGYNVKYEDLIFNQKNSKAIEQYFTDILPKIDIYDTKEVKKMFTAYKNGETKYFWDVSTVLISCIRYEECFNVLK